MISPIMLTGTNVRINRISQVMQTMLVEIA